MKPLHLLIAGALAVAAWFFVRRRSGDGATDQDAATASPVATMGRAASSVGVATGKPDAPKKKKKKRGFFGKLAGNVQRAATVANAVGVPGAGAVALGAGVAKRAG